MKAKVVAEKTKENSSAATAADALDLSLSLPIPEYHLLSDIPLPQQPPDTLGPEFFTLDTPPPPETPRLENEDHALGIGLNVDYSQLSSPAINVIFKPHGGMIGLGLHELYAAFTPGETFDLNRSLIVHRKRFGDYFKLFDDPTLENIFGFFSDMNETARATCKVAEVCNFDNPFTYRLQEPVKLRPSVTLTFVDETAAARWVQEIGRTGDISVLGNLSIDGRNLSNLDKPLQFFLNPRSDTEGRITLSGNAQYRDEMFASGLYLPKYSAGNNVGFGYKVGQATDSFNGATIDSPVSLLLSKQNGHVVLDPNIALTLSQHSKTTKSDFAEGVALYGLKPHFELPIFGGRSLFSFDLLTQGSLTTGTFQTATRDKQQQIKVGNGPKTLGELVDDIERAIPISKTTLVDTHSSESGVFIRHGYSLYGGLPVTSGSEQWGVNPYLAVQDTEESFKLIGGANFSYGSPINIAGAVAGQYDDSRTPFIERGTQYAFSLVGTPWSPRADIASRTQRYFAERTKDSLSLLSPELLAQTDKINFYRENPQLSLGVNGASNGSVGGFLGVSLGSPFWFEAGGITQDGNIQVHLDGGSGPLTASARYHFEHDPDVQNQSTQSTSLDLRWDVQPKKWGILVSLTNDPNSGKGVQATLNYVLLDW